MADTFTTNLNLTKPEPGAAEDTWGISLNSDLDTLDAIFSSSGTQVNLNPNQVNFADNKKAVFGTGNDLQIYHDGTHSYLLESNAIGNLYLGGDNLFLTNANATKVYVKGIDGGATELRHNNLTKLATTSTGINVTGTATMDGLTVDGAVTVNSNTTTAITATQNANTDINGLMGIRINNSTGTTYAAFGNSGADSVVITAGDAGGTGNTSLTLKTATSGSEKSRLNISGTGDISFYDDTGTTQALFWDASTERLGIGNTLPTSALDVTGTVTADGLTVDGDVAIASDLPTITLTDNNNSSSRADIEYNFGYLSLDADANAVDAAEGINLKIGGTTHFGLFTGGDISFYDDTGTSQALFWDASAESLGIGTTSPRSNYSLDVRNAANNGVNIQAGDEAADIALSVGSAGTPDKFVVTSGGSVGIGTSSPANLLQVGGTVRGTASIVGIDGASPYLKLDHTATTSGRSYSIYSGGLAAGNFDIYDNTASAARLSIDSSGRVGIGTTSPDANSQLHIKKIGANAKITLETDESNDCYINFSGATSEASLGYEPTSNAIVFANAGDGLTSNERMRITSSGNIGIGTTSPSAILHTVSANANGTDLATSATNAKVRFQNHSTSTLSAYQGYTGNSWYTQVANSSGTTSYDLSLNPYGGNVGIGTPTPNYKLEINHTGADTLALVLNDEDTVSNATGLYLRSTSEGRISFGSGAALTFAGNGGSTERMRIDSSGNVGIGTSSPDYKLTIGDATDSAGTDLLSLEGGGYLTRFRNNSDVTLMFTNTTKGIAFGTQGTSGEKMRIDSSGNVGIGTTSPASALHIRDASNAEITIQDAISSATARIGVYGAGGNLTYDTNSSGQHIFTTNNRATEFMRIDSSGNLLVGKTYTAASIAGQELRAGGYTAFTRSGGNPLELNRLSSDGTIANFSKDGSTIGSIGVVTSDNLYIQGNSTHNGLAFGSNALIPFKNGAYTDNVCDIGGSSNRFKDLHLSGQANVGSVLATGNVTAYSDERLKDNIQTLQGSKVLEMRGVSFTKDGKASSGVIAQEIEKVAPELVHTAKDEMGTKSVAYGNLVGYLIEAIKDQQQQIDELKARLDNDSSK